MSSGQFHFVIFLLILGAYVMSLPFSLLLIDTINEVISRFLGIPDSLCGHESVCTDFSFRLLFS